MMAFASSPGFANKVQFEFAGKVFFEPCKIPEEMESIEVKLPPVSVDSLNKGRESPASEFELKFINCPKGTEQIVMHIFGRPAPGDSHDFANIVPAQQGGAEGVAVRIRKAANNKLWSPETDHVINVNRSEASVTLQADMVAPNRKAKPGEVLTGIVINLTYQ